MNDKNIGTNNTSNNDNIDITKADQSNDNSGSDNTSNNDTSSVNMDNSKNLESSIIEQAYKELYEQQNQEIEALKKEISAVKLQNQKLAIQQNVGSPRITAEELINKMFQ